MYYDDKSDILYVAYCRCMCMFYVWYINDCYCEMDVQMELHCMISYFIIMLPCIMSDTLYVAYHSCMCMFYKYFIIIC
jgi:hypothetical protein